MITSQKREGTETWGYKKDVTILVIIGRLEGLMKSFQHRKN